MRVWYVEMVAWVALWVFALGFALELDEATPFDVRGSFLVLLLPIRPLPIHPGEYQQR
jgi:hypothetical protein